MIAISRMQAKTQAVLPQAAERVRHGAELIDSARPRWSTSWNLSLSLILLVTAFAGKTFAVEGEHAIPFRAALMTSDMATDARLQKLRTSGYTAAVLTLTATDASSAALDRQAVERIAKSGLALSYWIEIGRCPEMADGHPLWMASLQGHLEWRRLYKDFPEPKEGDVVKVYPWCPIFYREARDAHLDRIKRLLADRPPAKGVYLNDLQGAPSACGCGNPVCRWTTDYGPIVTATKLGDDAPARFIADVKRLVPTGAEVIPVWTTECEEHDRTRDALCAGVGCYKGTCWRVYSRQLKPVAAESGRLGALLLYKEFGQDGPFYHERAGWIRHALTQGFATQPTKYGGPTIAASRLLAVLQGWNVSDAELQAQIEQARLANAAGCIIALARIDQSWRPRMVKWK
jgi:hypothetical protein